MTNLNKNHKLKEKKFRKFLYEEEIEQLLNQCENTKFPLRNKTLILVTYMHAFRAGEVCKLTWDQIDFKNNRIYTESQKGGRDSLQPLWESEKELLLELQEQRLESLCAANSNFEDNSYVFASSRWGTKFEPVNYYRLTMKLGQMCGFDFRVTPHMLRHSRGTFLANKGIHILKIKNLLRHVRLSSTELYTHMNPDQFMGINENSLFN